MQVLRAGTTSTRHENDASGTSCQDHSVSESEDWRSINDHQPVCCQLTQQIAHHGGPQQLGGIRRHSACGQELQALHRPLDQSLTKVRRTRQNVCEPRTALKSSRTGCAQIPSDQDNPMPGQSQDPRQAGSGDRGPLLRTCGGDDNDSPATLRQRMEHIGTGYAQLFLHLELRPSTQPPQRRNPRQGTEQRHRQRLTNLLRPPEALVEQLLNEDPDIAQDQPGQQPHRHTGHQGRRPSRTDQLSGGQQDDLHGRVLPLQVLDLGGGLTNNLVSQNLSPVR